MSTVSTPFQSEPHSASAHLWICEAPGLCPSSQPASPPRWTGADSHNCHSEDSLHRKQPLVSLNILFLHRYEQQRFSITPTTTGASVRWCLSALTVVGWRLLLLVSAPYAASAGGSVVVVLLLVLDENLPHHLLRWGQRLPGLQLHHRKDMMRNTQGNTARVYNSDA